MFSVSTGAFIETGAFAAVCDFLRDDGSDPHVYVCLDAPGMGKTRTVQEAAARCGAVYVCFPAGRGLLSNAVHRLRGALEEVAAGNAGLVEPAVAEKIAMHTWRVALTACVRHTATAIEHGSQQRIGTVHRDDIDWRGDEGSGSVEDELAAAHARLMAAATAHAPGTKCVLLHFDEIQAMVRDPAVDGRVQQHAPTTPVPPVECLRYVLVWFSAALHQVLQNSFIKPVITGISVDADDSLRFDSGMKKWPNVPLPYFTPAQAAHVLRSHVEFDDDALLQEVAQGAQGCPRAVQYVLLALLDRALDTLRGGSPSEHWTAQELLGAAISAWRTSGRGSFLRAAEEHARTARNALLAVLFPSPQHATRAVIDDIPVACLPVAVVPREWRDAAHVGVLRLRVSGDGNVVLFPPYPFLEAYLQHVSLRNFHVQDCIHLATSAYALSLTSGHFGRGKVFELAVALELCDPSSPLLLSVVQQPQLAGFAPLPSFCKLRSFASISDLPSHEQLQGESFKQHPCVFVVMDGSMHARPCDIALPVSYVDSGGRMCLQLVMIEVKSSNAQDPRYSRAYVRTGLSRFIEVSSRSFARPWPVSCYITNVDPHGSDDAVAAMRSWHAYNRSVRKMGLLVATEDFLLRCSLNLLAALHAEETAKYSQVEWYEALFADADARVTMYNHLKHMWGEAASSAVECAPAMEIISPPVGTVRRCKLAISDASGCVELSMPATATLGQVIERVVAECMPPSVTNASASSSPSWWNAATERRVSQAETLQDVQSLWSDASHEIRCAGHVWRVQFVAASQR